MQFSDQGASGWVFYRSKAVDPQEKGVSGLLNEAAKKNWTSTSSGSLGAAFCFVEIK